MNNRETNFNESLYAFEGSASHDEFWNLFWAYGFKVIPTVEHFKIAFGDDKGGIYFRQTKNLVNDFWNSVNACTLFEWHNEKWLDEINNPNPEGYDEAKKGVKDSTLELFELFFDKNTVNEYKKGVKTFEDTRAEMKNMIKKFGVERTRRALFKAYDENLRKVLEELGIEQIDKLVSKIGFETCYHDMDNIDDDIERDHELRKLAFFAKDDVLPLLSDKD